MEVEDDGEGEPRHVEKHEKLKKDREFATYKQKVLQIDGGVLNPGTYAIGFSLTLDKDLPSSIYYKEVRREEPKAKVKYVIKTVVHTVDE
jgi:hypothetical protein